MQGPEVFERCTHDGLCVEGYSNNWLLPLGMDHGLRLCSVLFRDTYVGVDAGSNTGRHAVLCCRACSLCDFLLSRLALLRSKVAENGTR